MREETLKTLYNIIEHTNDHINDLLENHHICKLEVRHALMEHIDNLKDTICILEKMGEGNSSEIKLPEPAEERMMISRKS